jgi:hypothetical protein
MPELDHVLWAAPDLEKGVEELYALTGVTARPGGRHPGMGTHNALLGLGRTYLEVLAPDPTQPGVGPGVELAALPGPRLHAFAARTRDLEADLARLERLGIGARRIEMSRARPDGGALRWRLALLLGHDLGRSVPFLIDWGDAPHPSAELPRQARLIELALRHPRPGALARVLEALALELRIEESAQAGLRVVLETPRGRVELAS